MVPAETPPRGKKESPNFSSAIVLATDHKGELWFLVETPGGGRFRTSDPRRAKLFPSLAAATDWVESLPAYIFEKVYLRPIVAIEVELRFGVGPIFTIVPRDPLAVEDPRRFRADVTFKSKSKSKSKQSVLNGDQQCLSFTEE